jgi:hypothetical protein
MMKHIIEAWRTDGVMNGVMNPNPTFVCCSSTTTCDDIIANTTTPYLSSHLDCTEANQDDAQDDATGDVKFLMTSTSMIFCYPRRNRIPRLPQAVVPTYDDDARMYQDDTMTTTTTGHAVTTPTSSSAAAAPPLWCPLQQLHSFVYYNLVADLQSTLKYRSGWLLLFWLPFCGWASCSSVWLSFFWGNHHRHSWQIWMGIAGVAFAGGKICYRYRLMNIESEIHERVLEWLPYLEEHGFAINYVVDDPNWLCIRKETYIHIYPSKTRPLPAPTTRGRRPQNAAMADAYHQYESCSCYHLSSTTNTNPPPIARFNSSMISGINVANGDNGVDEITTHYEKEDTKYIVFYPMEFCRRNIDARRIGCDYILSASASATPQLLPPDGTNNANRYVQPPSLRNLDATMLSALLHDIDLTTTPSHTIRILVFIFLFAVFMMSVAQSMLRWSRPTNEYTYNGSLVSFRFLLFMYVLDRWIRLYTNWYAAGTDIQRKVDTEWNPRWNAYGYTVQYHVDQPHWWSWREEYVHVQKMR